MNKEDIGKMRKSLIVEGLLWLSLPSFIIIMSLMAVNSEMPNLRIALYIALALVIIISNIRIIMKAKQLVTDYNKEQDEKENKDGTS